MIHNIIHYNTYSGNTQQLISYLIVSDLLGNYWDFMYLFVLFPISLHYKRRVKVKDTNYKQ